MQRFRGFVVMLIALCGVGMTGATAIGDERMVWFYDQFNDAADRGRTVSVIGVGVPETDYALLEGSCAVGSSGNFARVTFTAPTGGMAEGAPAEIEFFADTVRRRMAGRIVGTELEVGVSGIEVIIENDDPIWTALQRLRRIRYRANGEVIELPLRGSGAAIDSFLADCRFYARAGTDGEPGQLPAAESDPRWATCEVYRDRVSENSDIPVSVTFTNRSEGFRTVMWVGFDGILKEYGALDPGESLTVDTFVTHPWMFTDGPGNCLEMFMPQPGVPVFEIAAPNRDFGPE